MTSEEPIVINHDRSVTVPEDLKIIAVQYDHNVETVNFTCPRYWDDHDFTEMNIYVNYMRSDGKCGQFLCENVEIDSDDEDIIHFTWTIYREATLTKGVLAFLVCAKKTDTLGNEINHWNSQINKEMRVLDGLPCSNIVEDTNPDVIEQILARLTALEQGGGGGIPEAPIDGKQYARQDGAWAEVEGGSGGQGWTTEQIDLLEDVFEHTMFMNGGEQYAQQLIESLRGGIVPEEPITITFDGTTAVISGLASTNINYSGTTAEIGG